VLGGPRVGGDDSGPWPLSFSDDPEHARNRALNQFVVARDRLAKYDTLIRRHANALIDAFVERGAAELRTEFATPLPRRVMVEILGARAEDDAKFAEWFGGQGPRGTRLASPEEQAYELKKTDELREYMRMLVLERIDEPQDDYMSDLVLAQVARDGEPDIPYLITEGVNLFGAAVGTTAHFIANMFLLLLQHPEELVLVREDRSRIRPVLEESLRRESPVQWSGRVAAVDTELHGVPISKGSNLLLMWGSANHDPEQFEDPERYWIGRPGVAKYHMAFGYGMHMCIGAPLARLEAQISLELVLDRLPNLRFVDGFELEWLPRVNQRAPEAVSVVFDAS
jgi:cytochrome P450